MTVFHSSLCKLESLESGIIHGEVLQHFVHSGTVDITLVAAKKEYNFFCIFHSTIVTGPVTHYLYHFLEGVVPKRSKFSSVKKAVLDRLLFAPPYLLALFYSVAIMEASLLERKRTFMACTIGNDSFCCTST